MTTLTTLLVGQHYHPPAKILLEHLPAGASLRLIHYAENPYDERAIGVWVEPKELPESQWPELEVKLPGQGFDLKEMLQSNEPLMLGHCAASGGKPLGKALLARSDLVSNAEIFDLLPCNARLVFDGSGATLIEVTVPEAGQ